ncbi:MAG: O-methyltransferase [Hyphomicrobiales bacterium]
MPDPRSLGVFRPGIEEYALAHSTPEPPYLAELARETAELTPNPEMMVGPLGGRFLAFLVAMLQPRNVLEIGMFTGYSALSMAAALPPGGRITTCEISPQHEAIARRHIERSPFADRIDIRMGPALDTVRGLEGPFDFVFIDADKGNYINYYEAVVPKLAERSVIAVDNVLWYGATIDPSNHEPDTEAIRAFNAHVAADPRTECVMLTVRDGVTLVRRV